MVQIYIKYIDDNYYLLDLDENEVVNFKLTAKDLSDITKIFAPFTQSFKIPATDKNKRLCGFVGNEKIQRINNDGKFDAMLYISGFLFQTGKLSFDESEYERLDQKEFKTNFASNLTGLKELLGDMTIQELFQDSIGKFDDKVRVDWNKVALQTYMKTVTSVTLDNGIGLKYGVPFISNKRVWTYDSLNLNKVDNIAFKINRTPQTVNQIELDEVRPAVSYMTIMEHLLLKIGVPVTCPIFNNPEVKDLYVYGSADKLVVPNQNRYQLKNFGAINYSTNVIWNQLPEPTIKKWTVTKISDEVFKIKRNAGYDQYWGVGVDVSLTFANLVPLEGTETNIKCAIINAATNDIINIEDITSNFYFFTLIDNGANNTYFDNNGELTIRFEILPNTICSWSSIECRTTAHYAKMGVLAGLSGRKAYYDYNTSSFDLTNPALLGGNKINLITALPKIKAADFLKSFFMTFNISVISTGLPDGSMYWVTPNNIKESNKPYSKRIVDYTAFTNIQTTSKKRGNEYNQYVFKHKESKYYEAVYGNGMNFGELRYPTLPPAKPTKFEVVTEYSIIKQSTTFVHPNGVRTCLAFAKDTPDILPNGGNRYKAVYNEFTLMYLKPFELQGNDLSLQLTDTQNYRLTRVLESSFKNPTSGKTLAFGAENVDTNSLYLNYYKDFIELLLRPNTYKSEFEVYLPANEIFLNFSNLNQGESNIPTGFRPQNEIIIGEQRYYLLEATINTNNGKTKLTLLNF